MFIQELFFNFKADFLPADVRSELSRFERKKAAKQQQMGDSQAPQANTPFTLPTIDEAYLKEFSNEVEKMKTNSEKFAIIFRDELKMCLPKDQPKLEMLNIGKQSEVVKNKMSEWQKVKDCFFSCSPIDYANLRANGRIYYFFLNVP